MERKDDWRAFLGGAVCVQITNYFKSVDIFANYGAGAAKIDFATASRNKNMDIYISTHPHRRRPDCRHSVYPFAEARGRKSEESETKLPKFYDTE